MNKAAQVPNFKAMRFDEWDVVDAKKFLASKSKGERSYILWGLFLFQMTPQGFDYWDDIIDTSRVLDPEVDEIIQGFVDAFEVQEQGHD